MAGGLASSFRIADQNEAAGRQTLRVSVTVRLAESDEV